MDHSLAVFNNEELVKQDSAVIIPFCEEVSEHSPRVYSADLDWTTAYPASTPGTNIEALTARWERVAVSVFCCCDPTKLLRKLQKSARSFSLHGGRRTKAGPPFVNFQERKLL